MAEPIVASAATAVEPKYTTLVGFIYVFNLIVGTGSLAIPKAFGDAGYLLGLIILASLGFVGFISATFMIECMSAANAVLESRRMHVLKQLAVRATDDSSGHVSDTESGTDRTPLLKGTTSISAKPQYFEITKRVEMGHMASLFLNKTCVYVFYLCLAMYLYGDLAIYATVVPKSLKHVACTYVPENYTQSCSSKNHSLSDNLPCWKDGHPSLTRGIMYRIFVLCFSCLGIFIFFDVSKTKYLQLLTSASRWAAFIIMVVLTARYLDLGKGAGHPHMVNFHSFGPLFGVCVYAFMSHHSLPALLTPIQNKAYLYPMLFSTHLLIFVFYASLALTGIFAFSKLADVYTLNFQGADCGGPPVTDVVFIQYFLALFPVFSLSTNFPLVGVTLKNNLRKLVYGDETPKIQAQLPRCYSAPNLGLPSEHGLEHQSTEHSINSQTGGVQSEVRQPQSFWRWPRVRWFVECVIIPLAVFIPPILIALGTENVEFLVAFTGSYAGAGVQYVIPSLLIISVRRNVKELIGLNVPRRYLSPFRGTFWPWFVLLWALFTVVIVTVNHIMFKR